MGVDFAANASSKAIKESVVLSAAITAVSLSGGSNVSTDGRIATFNYNGTYTENKIAGTTCTTGNNVGMNGSVQSVKLAPGVYLLEAWGAQGGTGDGGVAGGKGGYVKGYYKITGNSFVTIYVAVGGKGSNNYRNEIVATSATERGQAKGGGWNGGGGVLSTGAGTGGGATHFALSNHGQLKDYKTYSSAWTKTTDKYEPTTVTADYSGDVLMVAGGGGGATWASYTFPAGHTCAGGGLTGADGMYQPVASGSWGGGNVCHGLGGKQTEGGGHKCATTTAHGMASSNSWKAHPSSGYFGQGGVGVGDNWGGGAGGGGWYGGGGAHVVGGGGGSSYTKASVITDVTHTQGNREGHGAAKITLVSGLAEQTSIPTVTINRHDSKTFAFAGTSNENSLLGEHANNLALSVHTNAVYQVNGLADTTTQETLLARTFTDAEKADATANSWLSYSFTSNGVTLKATRYWTGTKAFYVKIKDANDVPSWFKFYATVEGGELKKDTTPTGDFKFGKSTTQVPTQ